MDDKADEKKSQKSSEELDKILYELVVRQSALENLLLKFNLFTEKDLAVSQIETMFKLKKVIEMNQAQDKDDSGFIKYGDVTEVVKDNK